jgi:very-short-patch-repair endonuclease
MQVKLVSKGSWCPLCKNKTESKIMNFLKTNKINFIHQFKLLNCNKRFDFFCVDKNTIIEIDGRQHFEDVIAFKSDAVEIRNNDCEKMIQAIEKGHNFLRIYQPDVWNDCLDWKSILLSIEHKSTPTISFFSTNEHIYDAHKLLLSDKLIHSSSKVTYQ